MPFCFDFNLAHGDVHTVELSPDGWKSPIFVEYIVAQAHRYDTMRSIVWRVKGTTHSFTIEEQRLNHLTHGNYKAHFKRGGLHSHASASCAMEAASLELMVLIQPCLNLT